MSGAEVPSCLLYQSLLTGSLHSTVPHSGSFMCTQLSPVVQLSGGPLTWLVSPTVKSYQSPGNQLCVHSRLLLSSYLEDL